MIDADDLKLAELHRLIAKLPPGRARRKYEETLRGLLGRVEPNDDKQNTTPISDPKNDDVSIDERSV